MKIQTILIIDSSDCPSEEAELEVKQNIFEILSGEVIKNITGVHYGSREVKLITESKWLCTLYHHQDCCEDVMLEDFDLDPGEIIGQKIYAIQEVSGNPIGGHRGGIGQETWTFYKIATEKNSLWMSWSGGSNGYYRQKVDIKLEKLQV